jgi:type I restriction enzyme, S subunit
MSLFEVALPTGRTWERVGSFFEVTRKPRSVNPRVHEAILFVPMEAIPAGGAYAPRYDTKPGRELSSGTYFERGDLLIAKITPSFENGKQAFVRDMVEPFGYATTEVIPLRRRNLNDDPRLLFFYLLHPEVRSFVAERMEGLYWKAASPGVRTARSPVSGDVAS